MPDPNGKSISLESSDTLIFWSRDLDSGAYDFHVLTYCNLQVWQIKIHT